MKKTLLFACAIFFSLTLFAQIQTDQLSDFEDGTVQGWSNGGSSPNPPTNIPTGGPNGADDNFLEEISAGGGGAGSKMLIQNDNPEWTGSYTAANIANFIFDIKNAGASDLSIRIGMEGGPNNSRMVTTSFTSLPSSQTTWTTFDLAISTGSFTVVSGPDSVEDILADVKEVRILSNPMMSYNGEAVAGVMHIDNILAEGALSVDDNLLNTVQIFPNPVRDLLNISAKTTLKSYEIYNVLGSLVMSARVGDMNTTIDVSSLRSGVYMLRLNAGEGSQTKRFVKSN